MKPIENSVVDCLVDGSCIRFGVRGLYPLRRTAGTLDPLTSFWGGKLRGSKLRSYIHVAIRILARGLNFTAMNMAHHAQMNRLGSIKNLRLEFF